MKALIDTNILLDVIFQREPHLAESKRVLECCISLADGYIAVYSFSNMFYIMHVREGFSVAECRGIFNKFLYVFDVATLDKADVIAAVNNGSFSDLEDSMQHEAAVASEIDCIVTRNGRDFEKANVAVLSPARFVQVAHEKNVAN